MSIAAQPAPSPTSDAQELDSILQHLERVRSPAAVFLAEAALPLVELIAPMRA